MQGSVPEMAHFISTAVVCKHRGDAQFPFGRALRTETKFERGDVSKQKWNLCQLEVTVDSMVRLSGGRRASTAMMSSPDLMITLRVEGFASRVSEKGGYCVGEGCRKHVNSAAGDDVIPRLDDRVGGWQHVRVFISF